MRWTFIIFLLFSSSDAQVNQPPRALFPKGLSSPTNVRGEQQSSQVSRVFQTIENGIRKSVVNEFEKDFGTTVTIAIGSAERGYFSKNQSASVLSEYFSTRRLVSFKFSRIHETGVAPFATGRLVYLQKGNQESVQVYVSLTRQDDRWVISQFNIY
jgi:hypothetical protein